MLGSQYGVEQLQIWFHRCLHFYGHILFHKVKWTALSTNKMKLHEGSFVGKKALLPTDEGFVTKFSIEAGVHLPLCANDK